MYRLKKFTTYLLKALLGILSFLSLYFLFGFLLSLVSTNPKPTECETKQEIYLTTNGIHADIVMSKQLIDSVLLAKLNVPERTKYIAFGWGDKGFYLETPTWKDLKFRVAMKAMFWKSETAMHVTFRSNKSSSWQKVALCATQQNLLMTYINDSFMYDEKDCIVWIDTPGYSQNDRFYEAVGSYSFLKTCNNWVNIGLKKAHVKTALWSPFDFGVLRHAKRNAPND